MSVHQYIVTGTRHTNSAQVIYVVNESSFMDVETVFRKMCLQHSLEAIKIHSIIRLKKLPDGIGPGVVGLAGWISDHDITSATLDELIKCVGDFIYKEPTHVTRDNIREYLDEIKKVGYSVEEILELIKCASNNAIMRYETDDHYTNPDDEKNWNKIHLIRNIAEL